MKRRSLLKCVVAAIASPLAAKSDLSVLKAENTPLPQTISLMGPDDCTTGIKLKDSDTLSFSYHEGTVSAAAIKANFEQLINTLSN